MSLKLTKLEILIIAVTAMNGKSFLELAIEQIGTDTTKSRVYCANEVLMAYVLQTSKDVYDELEI